MTMPSPVPLLTAHPPTSPYPPTPAFDPHLNVVLYFAGTATSFDPNASSPPNPDYLLSTFINLEMIADDPATPSSSSPLVQHVTAKTLVHDAGTDNLLGSNPQRPSIRPNPAQSAQRSKFDLEPNPFEQSFSKGSHHSNSSGSLRTTPPRGGDATSIKHNALPPLSSLTSPAAADPSQFPWLASQSLRTGPLSPAMLAGPQPNPHHHGASGLRNGTTDNHDNQQGGAFDSNNFRTGFTPGTGSGFTPGYSSLMNGTNFGALPLPSPNTAAFLNMVTNATPIGENGPGSEHQPHQMEHHQHGPLHPPSALPPHLQHHGLSHLSEHQVQQDTITPNTLSALTGVFNDMTRGVPQHQQQPPYYAQAMHNPHAPPQPIPQPIPGHPDYAQQSANAASQAANGLFLLSQAHQELSKREEEGRVTTPITAKKVPPGAVPPGPIHPMNGNGMGVMGPVQGQKRKSDVGIVKPPAAKKGKKASLTASDIIKAKHESASPDFGMMMDDDDDGEERLGPDGKPETEEDKRKNFLERNRQGQFSYTPRFCWSFLCA